MLPCKYRLVKNKDFQSLSQVKDSLANKLFVLKWKKNKLNYSRFGIVVSIKVDKRAARRNKIKRRIRNIIKNNLANIKKGYDFLIITRKGVREKKFQDISSNLLKLFKRTNLYVNKKDSS